MSHVLTLPSGEQLNYQLERRQRRTVGLKITADGLIVHAPKRISQSLLDSLITQKADWIQKNSVRSIKTNCRIAMARWRATAVAGQHRYPRG
jgi:predicted metal-dependent hydrolase